MAKVATVATIGAGSMGSSMALLFSEKGDVCAFYDKDSEAMKKTISSAESANISLLPCSSLSDLVNSFDTTTNGPRIIILSLPHGSVVDSILEELLPLLSPSDVILDGGNEWYRETERRQKAAKEKDVYYLGMGVSGGYQSARRGPSMSPGGNEKGFEIVKTRLEDWAAKDRNGVPCVGLVGSGGSGHYVKMIHNGIEQGHLSILAEAHHLLHWTAGFSNSEIADMFDEWNGTKRLDGLKNEDVGKGGEKRELEDNFLIKIGAEIMRFQKGDGIENPKGIVDDIEDKVTQDIDESEGTGVWTVRELAARHIAAPTIAAAHQLRLISGPRGSRKIVADELKIPKPKKGGLGNVDKEKFVEDVRLAVYAGILGSYVQGLNILAQASEDEKWNLDFAQIINLWRAGCIIQSTAISNLLEPIFKSNPKTTHLLQTKPVASELRKCYDSLKRVVVVGVESDSVIPAMDATLGWLKSVGGEELPTNFEEAELDYFGHHNYDIKGEEIAEPKKGTHHTEFKPA